MREAVIWDMDGVLVDTGPFHYRAWRRLFREKGRELTEQEFLQRFGMKSVDIIRATFGSFSADQAAALAHQKEEYYREEVAGHIEPLPGAKAIVESLHQAGFRQAIASSAPHKNIGLVLESTGLGRYLDAVVSGDEVSEGKPNPEIFLVAAGRLAVPPSRSIVVEDSLAGVAAAKAAGMRCIGVTNTNSRQKLAAADLVVDSLEELSAQIIGDLIGSGK